MKVIVYAKYADDRARLLAARSKHRSYLAGLRAEGKLAAAGPFSDDSGTLIIYDVPKLEDAQALVASDPFTLDGVFVSCEIIPWKIVFSEPGSLNSDV